MNIRPFKKEDQEQVYKLIHDIILSEFKVESTAYKMSDLKDVSKTYGSNKKEIFLIAENDGHVIGTVGVKQEDDETALLRRLFLSPEQRSKGFGQKLVKRALQFAKKAGYKKIKFNGTSTMIAALTLCEKTGFIRKEDIDMNGFHLYRCEKLLRGTSKDILRFLMRR